MIMHATETYRQQMFSMIAQWQQSGLSQKAYCLQNNIAYYVFHYWYKCYRDKRPTSVNPQFSFVQLQVNPGLSVPAIELQLGDGRRSLFHQPVSSDYLKSLIR
jgi:hypothetical protein